VAEILNLQLIELLIRHFLVLDVAVPQGAFMTSFPQLENCRFSPRH